MSKKYTAINFAEDDTTKLVGYAKGSYWTNVAMLTAILGSIVYVQVNGLPIKMKA